MLLEQRLQVTTLLKANIHQVRVLKGKNTCIPFLFLLLYTEFVKIVLCLLCFGFDFLRSVEDALVSGARCPLIPVA